MAEKLCHKCHKPGQQANNCPPVKKGKVAAASGPRTEDNMSESLGAVGQVPGEVVKTVLDLTKQDFQDISNVTGCMFEIGVQHSGGSVSTVVCPNSEFLSQDLKGEHSWLNACSAKELSERVRHVLSACVASLLTTSVCVLIRQSMPIDMSLLKDFRCHFDCA
jgi:hypothetical protein